MSAIIAIVGEQNVGKSTLFNRIIGKRRAIECDFAGTTRDVLIESFPSESIDAKIIDTGGITFDHKGDPIEADVLQQASMAISDAHIILFCIDSRVPIHIHEKTLRLLRRNIGKTPVVIILTKCEGKERNIDMHELYRLGLGDNIIFISSHQNTGIQQLTQTVEKILLERGFSEKEIVKENQNNPKIAFVGRPNIGKSSLINALSSSKKVIVSNIPGTTRDTIDIEIQYHKESYTFIDTAGLRRKSKVHSKVEQFSGLRTLAALSRSDVAVLLIDSLEGVTHQDQYIASEILKAECGIIIAVSKWDDASGGRFSIQEDFDEDNEEEEEDESIVDYDAAQNNFIRHLQIKLPFLSFAPVIFLSAHTKKNIFKFFDIAQDIQKERSKRIGTNILNHFIQSELLGRSGTDMIKYGTQVDICPPHFIFFAKEAVKYPVQRFIHRKIRESFGFNGTPILVEIKKK